jgi:signal peptidase II
MLCFIFAALAVVLDQVFKRWIMLTVEYQGHVTLIPGVIELTHFQNTGAAFSILADKRWLLAGISLVAAIILIFILLRYTEGF